MDHLKKKFWIPFQQGTQFQIGNVPTVLPVLIRMGDNNTFHARRFGSDHAIERIFHAEASSRVAVEALGTVDEYLWIGFAIGQVLCRGKNGKLMV